MPNNIYRNSEGYYDPTAGSVIAKCDRKEKSDHRKAIRKANIKARKQAAAESRTIQPLCWGYRKEHPRRTEILQIRGR